MKMKKLKWSGIILMMLLYSVVTAQTVSNGDTLEVGPLNSEGQPLGALNEAIHGDTTAAGERMHKVYKLQRNAQYILTEVIQADFPLVIVAPEPTDDMRPPVIRCGLEQDGSAVANWWHIYDAATFKNLWMSGINLDGTGPISWIAQTVNSVNKTIKYEGCVIEYPYTWWATFADWGSQNDYYISNCIFKNIGNPSGTTWNGAIFYFYGGTMDSVIIRNTTFFNYGCFAASGRTFYREIDHCTFVNSVVHPLSNHDCVQMVYTNNLWVNCHAFSDDTEEISRHLDQEVKGIMNYAEIQWDPQDLNDKYGPGGVYGYNHDPDGNGVLTENELIWILNNNNWYYTQPVRDYWDAWADATKPVSPNPWMNNYNAAMFEHAFDAGEWTWTIHRIDTLGNPTGDDTVVTHQPFEYFLEANTWNVDPGLVDINNTDVLLAQNCDEIRRGWAGEEIADPVKWHGIDNYLAFTWPLDFDLSYSNATLLSAGTDGLPLGDLYHWFPEDYLLYEPQDPFKPAEPHFAPVRNTGNTMPVIIQAADIAGVPLVRGDEIAVYDDTLCVGSARFSGAYPLTITVFIQTEIPDQDPLPGGREDEPMQFKIWDADTETEYNAQPGYAVGSGLFGEPLVVVNPLSASLSNDQKIRIKPAKLNMISMYLQPDNPAIESVTDDIATLLVTQDDAGHYFIPPYGVNSIHDINVAKGYQVYYTAAENDTLIIEGESLNPSALSHQFSNTKLFMIGYPYQLSYPVTDVFASITDKVVVVQDDDGHFWIPSYGVNSINNMQPGKGYQIYVNQSVDYTYPGLTGGSASLAKSKKEKPEAGAPEFFKFKETGQSYAVLINESAEELQKGDEIAVFDEELCVGSVCFNGHYPVVIPAWEAIERAALPGFTPGNAITLRLYRKSHNKQYPLITAFEHPEHAAFKGAAFSVCCLQASDINSAIPETFALDQNFPNPFNPETRIRYQLPEAADVSLVIYNMMGQQVKTLVSEKQEAGYYEVMWRGVNHAGQKVGSGMYLLWIQAGKSHDVRKLMLIQ